MPIGVIAQATIASLAKDSVQVPNLWDWARNPQKAYMDKSLLGYVAEVVRDPLTAYEREVSAIQDHKVSLQSMGLIRNFVIAAAVILAAVTFIPGLTIPFLAGANEYIGYLIFGIVWMTASRFITRRGIRARSAATEALRQLYPKENAQFDIFDDIFKVKPVVHPADRPLIAKQVTAVRGYAKRLKEAGCPDIRL